MINLYLLENAQGREDQEKVLTQYLQSRHSNFLENLAHTYIIDAHLCR